MTCGWIAAYRDELDFSEVLLTEALGRFHFVGDRYGEIVAAAHLANPEVWRRNLDHALELALRPFSSGIAFSSSDADLLHNIAAQCYWMREDGHPAILHLSKAYDLVKDSDVYERRSVIVGNMGAILYERSPSRAPLSVVSFLSWLMRASSLREIANAAQGVGSARIASR